MTDNKVIGTEALSYLTSHSFTGQPKVGGAKIIEHNCGIDIDNAARAYDHESETDYVDLMWTALNYLPSDGDLDAWYSAELLSERRGNTEPVLKWFHIHTEVADGEARGLHYEFLWLTDVSVPGFEVRQGDTVVLSDGGTLDVEHVEFHGDSGREEDAVLRLRNVSDGTYVDVGYIESVTVRRYV